MPEERHDTGSDAGPAQQAGAEDQPRGETAGVEVLTLVCETCGKDYFFEDRQPPAGMRCEKCGGTVFRTFHDHTGDEAADDFRDSTARDLDPDDAEGDVLTGDIMDLNNA
jgi:hypothetical protein